MDFKYILRAELKWLLVLILLVFAVQHEGQIVTCPLTCICVFDEVLHDNMAVCNFDNSTVEMFWYANRGHITLKFVCKDAVENYQYKCKDFPRFSFSSHDADLVVEGCAPSVFRCVHNMFLASSSINKFDAQLIAGSYITEDLSDFNRVTEVNMYLRDQDTEMPSVLPNSLPALSTFKISGGNLQLFSNLFSNSNLKYLRLILNNIRNFPPDTFNGLSKLNYMDIDGNFLENINANSFRGLDALKMLNINNSTLMSIDPQAFSSMKQLNTLSIVSNRLQLVPNRLLTGLNNLYKVSISFNEIEMNLDTHAFANLPSSIKEVDIVGSKVKHLPEHVFNGSTDIEQLYFNLNQIEYLPPEVFATTTGVKNLYLRENRVQNLPEKIFSRMTKLVHLDLSYNYIMMLTGNIFAYNSELKEVSLLHNELAHIDLDIFKGKSFNELNLASNKLQRIIGNTTLEWQTKRLNLRDNQLSVFEDWFMELVDLEDLDLSSNKIQSIKTSHIYRFKKVKIDLRNNSITEVVPDTSDTLVNVTSGLTLYLSNNPLQCDCVVTKLLKEWHKYGILADYEDVTCDNEDKLSKLDAYVQCNKTQALIALVGSSIIGSLVILVLLLTIFSRRWDIYEYINDLFKSNDSEDVLKKDDNGTFEMKEDVKPYDLFISFAHQDADIVTDKLLPILENDFKLKVCVHYRDWVVGDLIPVQIRESVESSTMTMIILTEYFLESEWSNLEFRTAHELSIADGKPRVIVVLINESITRHNKLRGDLKAYIDMNTYLIFHDNYFWDKLQKILPKYGNNKNKKGIFI